MKISLDAGVCSALYKTEGRNLHPFSKFRFNIKECDTI